MKDKRKKNKKETNWKIQQIMMMMIWSYNKTVKMRQTKTMKIWIQIPNQHNQMLWLKFWFQKLKILTKFWVKKMKEKSLLIQSVILNLYLLELKDYTQLNLSWKWFKLEKSLSIMHFPIHKSSKKLLTLFKHINGITFCNWK
jgi:hypothetical protein